MNALENQWAAQPPAGSAPEIRVGKTVVLNEQGKETDVFTMSLGEETIELWPLRNWGQLDVYKWRVRGKLPGTPAGLEITHDHVRVAGETVTTKDPEGIAKLQKLFNEWLALERESLQLARRKTQPKPAAAESTAAMASEPQVPRFHVELDKENQVHIKCVQGKETLATIGLNPSGFTSLVNQGLMHKPRTIKVGALHDWIELDGVLFSFEKGRNDAAILEKALNERYLSAAALGQGKDIVISPNAASSTGFDIQFPAKIGGVRQNRKHPLNEETLELLQDPDKCGLLLKGTVIKVSRPNFIFKRKTPDGGERYFEKSPETTVSVTDDDGQVRHIDLSQPVNYLRLSALELTAVFNHPSINQHGKISGPAEAPSLPPGLPPGASSRVATPPAAPVPEPAVSTVRPVVVEVPPTLAQPSPPPAAAEMAPAEKIPESPSAIAAPSLPPPNVWLQPCLSRPSIRHDWLACLVFGKLAQYFENSQEGQFGISPCWFSRIGEATGMDDPAFQGVFLTQKGGLGYLCQGHLARFHKGVAFIGSIDSALEGIDVNLVAVGLDEEQRVVFVVNDGFRRRFGIAEQTVIQELDRLKEYGALVMGVEELLRSQVAMAVVWSVPKEQESAGDPQPVETWRPDIINANLAEPPATS